MGAVVVVAAALAAAPSAFAQGGGGGGGGGCAPLTMIVKVVHADSGRSGIDVQATMRNCTSVPEPLALKVSVPNSTTVPFKFSSGGAALRPGGSLTMSASPIGSTPGQLAYGRTYAVIGTLTRTGATPKTLATLSTSVTMPPGPVA
jgi:hypothetical protein